ncbi:hypothetical protein BDP27DRAFT_1361276 [Rhodocollybia butyracea]|uniref:Uncharacterized protein n=1 Tax=Rhodocollybia butyracea TaxID=206335 RepID=A0A9P5PZC5_9AGAR|nr:hypothetical protein BDP27DRAFT_1361276 [Rhodocollybia butyracea]
MSGPYVYMKELSFDCIGFEDIVDTEYVCYRRLRKSHIQHSTTIQQLDALAEKVKAVFTPPQGALYRKQTSKNLQWECQVVVAVPISGIQEYFYSLVTAIKIKALENTELQKVLVLQCRDQIHADRRQRIVQRRGLMLTYPPACTRCKLAAK